MADHSLKWVETAEPDALRRAIRHAYRRLNPQARVIAEDYLAESSPIDLLAVGTSGELIAIRIAVIGPSRSDAALLVAGLADITWLAARARGLAQLAPELGLLPAAPPRAVLFATTFRSETRTAASSLTTQGIECIEYRCLRQRGQLEAVIEPLKLAPSPHSTLSRQGPLSQARPAASAGEASSEALGTPAAPQRQSSSPVRSSQPHAQRRPLVGLAVEASPSGFRTGLTDADLKADGSPS